MNNFSLGPAACMSGSDIFCFVQIIIDIINGALVPLILAIAFLVFIFGIFRFFIAGAEDETART